MTLILDGHAGLPDPTWETHFGLTQSKMYGRSWWQLRYTDGRLINEWDPDPGSPNGHCDWARTPKKGRQAVRLYYPDGRRFSQLGGSTEASGLFQLKVALRTISIGLGVNPLLSTLDGRAVVAHLIGMLDGLNGECVCVAWVPLPRPDAPPGLPQRSRQNEQYYATGRPGLFEEHTLTYQKELASYRTTAEYRAWQAQVQSWNVNARGEAIGPFRDNVNDMQFRRIGRLSADHLGLDDGDGR